MSYDLPTLSRLPSLPTHIHDIPDKETKLDPVKIDPHAVPRLVSSHLSGFQILAEGDERVSWLLWLVVACASLSGMLYGYDSAVISGVFSYVGDALGPVQLSQQQMAFVASATVVGALFGGLFGGVISDYTGRKWVLGIGDLIFIAGSIVQALSNAVMTLVAGRFVAGIGIGACMCAAPLYSQELAPTRLRGRMAILTIVAISLGQMLGYGFAEAFDDVPRNWRYMVGLGTVLATFQLFSVTYLPESPRFLIRRGETAAAEISLSRIYATTSSEEIALKLEALQAAVQADVENYDRHTFWQLVINTFRVASNRRALIVACGLQALQQLCGFNALMFYSASIFMNIGFPTPSLAGLVTASTSIVCTLIAMKYIDQLGRRKIILWSIPVMWLGLILAAVAFHYLTLNTRGRLWSEYPYSAQWSGVMFFSMLVYIAAYAIGLGNIPWQQGELFTLEVRGIGSSLASASNWGCNLLVTATFMPMMNAITVAGSFGVYAGLVVFGYLFCYYCYPETAGLSLEETRHIFAQDFGVQTSVRLRHQKSEIRARLREQRAA